MRTPLHVNSTSIIYQYGKSLIPFEKITHLEGFSNYTIIHTTDGRKTISSFNLKKFSKIIEKGLFIRTHKSFIINPLYLEYYYPKESRLIVFGNKNILVSRRNKPDLEKIIQSISLT